MSVDYQVSSEQALREILGEPVHELVLAKSAPTLTQPVRAFIEMSPFLCLATHAQDGSADVSPRGDAPGFVAIRDERTLIIPERPGNKRLDSVINIINQPHLGLLFVIPGVQETVRVNGTGVITTDPDVLGQFSVNGKLPQVAIVVSVIEAMGHCSKALRRSKLWQNDYRAQEKVPTLAEMMSGHLALDAATQTMLVDAIEDDAENNLY